MTFFAGSSILDLITSMFSDLSRALDEFADVLSGFDNIVLTDIYAGREKDIYNIKTEDLVEKIKPLNPNVYHFSDTDELIKFLNENLQENDIICSIGCGPVDKISQKLVDKPKCII